MAGGSYSRAPTSRTSLDEESVSRILLEANDAEAERAKSSCRWMVGFHGVALFVVALLASVEIAFGSSDDSKATPSPAGNNYTTVSLNVVHKPPVHEAPKIGSDACAWGGDEDCTINRCCNLEGHQCYVRDAGFAGCRRAPPEGWDGKLIGGFRGYEIQKATPDRCAPATSLWCVVVVSTPEEQQLLEMQEKHKVGIYACDAHAVFEGAAAPKNEVEAVADTKAVADIWEEKILRSDEWQQHDWTVKVDVDLVFFPGRLKQHIRKLCPPMGGGLYLKNANFQSGFLGSLEVFSQEALRRFVTTGKGCADHVNQKSENGFIKACMDAIGVGSMIDTTLLDDQYTRGGLSGLSSGVCQSGDTVGFHPFKTEWVWESCHDAASRISDGPNYKCLSMSCGKLLNQLNSRPVL